MTKKEALRQLFKDKRKSLTKQQLSDASNAILAQLQQTGFVQGQRLLLYKASPKKKEIPVENWITHFQQMELCFPKVIDNSGLMEAVQWDINHPFVPNKWGILEPKNNSVVPPKSIDVVIVPLLCFDLSGQRVGYGKGYYDRFLKRCRAEVKKIGVCFFDPLKQIEDVADTDVPLDVIITPRSVHTID